MKKKRIGEVQSRFVTRIILFRIFLSAASVPSVLALEASLRDSVVPYFSTREELKKGMEIIAAALRELKVGLMEP